MDRTKGTLSKGVGAAETLPKTVIDLSQSAVARYLQLATLFRKRIVTGEWPVGRQIPTVGELAEECQVARMTIRQALDDLEAEGYISRHRAKGTFVIAKPQRDQSVKLQTDWIGVMVGPRGASIEVLATTRGETLRTYEGDAGIPAPEYRLVRRRHSRNGKAFLLADLFIDERIADSISDQDMVSKTAVKMVADIPGVEITDVYQTLTIDTADLEASTLLGMPLNDPVALVQRVAVDRNGVILLVADGVYRGDMVHMEMKVK